MRRCLEANSLKMHQLGLLEIIRQSLPFKCISWKVGETTTSLEVVNSILSSALRSMPSAMMNVFGVLLFAGYEVKVVRTKIPCRREVARQKFFSGADQS
jgi:hypothetical protein